MKKKGIALLWDMLKWRLSRKRYVGKRIYILGKMRPVLAESYGFVTVKGIVHVVRKDSPYLTVDARK